MPTLNTAVQKLGFWGATCLVLGNIVGTGIFLLPASLGAFGTLGLVGWVTTTVGSLCLAIVFSRLSRKFPKAGGPYAYCREAFGDLVGFQIAFCYWIGTWAGNAAIATAFVSFLSFFWKPLADSPFLGFATAMGSVWFFTFLNAVSLRGVGIAQIVIVVLKIIPLGLIAITGVFYMDARNFLPLNPSSDNWWQVIGSTSALTLFAFLGLESATIPATSVHQPEKTIPRATLAGTGVAAVIYVWTTTVLLGMIPSVEIAKSNSPFADAAGLIFGPVGAGIVALCAVVSAFGTLNGWILLQGQMPMAAAQDGLFPAFFARLSRFGTPANSLVGSSVLMSGVLYLNYGARLVDQFTSIVTLTTFCLLIPYLFCAAAELTFVLSKESRVCKKDVARSVILTLIALMYATMAAIGSGQESIVLGLALMFLGLPLYMFMKPKKTVTA